MIRKYILQNIYQTSRLNARRNYAYLSYPADARISVQALPPFSQRDSKAINTIRSCRCAVGITVLRHGRGEQKRRSRSGGGGGRQPLQPATKPITINRSATAHSAKSTRFERAAALDYIPHSLRIPPPRIETRTYFKRRTPFSKREAMPLFTALSSCAAFPIKHVGVMVCG